MKYEILLLSRSKHEDYRWMIVPSYLSREQLAKIQKLCWSDQVRSSLREIGNKEVFPIYCVQLGNATALLRLSQTIYSDRWKRSITALQGICVQKEYSMYLRFVLSWLITVSADRLDTASKLNLEEANDYNHRISGSHYLDMGCLNELPIKVSQLTKQVVVTTEKNKIMQFNKQGFEELTQQLLPLNISELREVQIAFGSNKRDSERFRDFDYIAYI